MMALVAVCSKAVILLLFIHCLLSLPLGVGIVCWVLVLSSILQVLVSFLVQHFSFYVQLKFHVQLG